MSTIKIGIAGFGHLGLYIVQNLFKSKPAGIELAWIWNRTSEKIAESIAESGIEIEPGVVDKLVLKDIKNPPKVDVILEVCHPAVLAENIEAWLGCARAVYVGSPTGFADPEVLAKSLAAAQRSGSQVFVPAGALWGVQDIQKMGARKSIAALHVTMKKPAASTRLNEPLQSKVDAFLADKSPEAPASLVVYDGPVGVLCPLAPNNVNTMACAALASGPELGFAGTRGTFVIERNSNAHIIDIEVVGKTQPGFTEPLTLKTTRVNPCAVGAVTGMATYVSFYSSLLVVVETLQREGGSSAASSSALRFC